MFQDYNILVVDDDKFMTSLLKQYMPNAFIAHSANLALKLLIESNNRIDLVLTDLHMPIMDGITLAYSIKNQKEYKHIPIILMTSDTTIKNNFTTDPEFNVFEALLIKPFTFNELNYKISAAFRALSEVDANEAD